MPDSPRHFASQLRRSPGSSGGLLIPSSASFMFSSKFLSPSALATHSNLSWGFSLSSPRVLKQQSSGIMPD
eukprot:5637835-Alexandrium_andersonii.AAC.1